MAVPIPPHADCASPGGPSSILAHPQYIHPALWRGNQLSRHLDRCVETGHAALSAELPGGGWPLGALIEILPHQPGIGEIRLLRPALRGLEKRRGIALVQPPFVPHAACYATWQLDPQQLLWIAPRCAADALWATEQILKNGSCAAVLCWQPAIRPESLRRLHLAAQGSDTLFFMLRPASAACNASPAPLRIALDATSAGVTLRIVKRRGPAFNRPLVLALDAVAPTFPPLFPHAPLDRRAPAPAMAGRPAAPAALSA